jgi:tripeptide aminopeptidase
VHNHENGFVSATLPSNVDFDVPTIGFIAHFDTADFNSENIQPQVHEDYDGKDIVLNSEENIVLSVDLFPNVAALKGHTLITTDGTTLLGADDKAGVAEIIEAMIYLMEHPEIKHGKIRIAFGPDEEIGLGADHFDAQGFAADFAYTMDGGSVGELEFESFNAAQARVFFTGVSVHPGSAKGKMINAAKLALEYDALLPQDEVPEKTEGYEGFYMLQDLRGDVENASMTYILRDHDRQRFEVRKTQMLENAETINTRYANKCVRVVLTDQYYNMGEVIAKDMRPVELAKQAMKNLDIQPNIKPIRGGTDGSKISFMGIPTPNLFTGGENYHGRYECVSVDVMLLARDTIIEIVKINAQPDSKPIQA